MTSGSVSDTLHGPDSRDRKRNDMNDNKVEPELVEKAIAAALDARDAAYSPYSDFPMGAAVVARDGTIVRGALVENVSLGLSMCSERVALFGSVMAAVAPVALAVASRRTDDSLTFPCGACLQVALEIAGPELIVVAVDLDGDHEAVSLSELLPRAPHRFTAVDRL